MKKALLLAGVAAFVASNVSAVELVPYVGADYNYTFSHWANRFGVDGEFPGQYHSLTVVAGTKVTPYAGVEAFGEMSRDENKRDIRTRTAAYGVDLLGYMPFGCYGEYELIGTAGMGRYYWKGKNTKSGDHESLHEWTYRLGGGFQYNITDTWAVRAMYRHEWVQGKTVGDKVSVGVRYHF